MNGKVKSALSTLRWECPPVWPVRVREVKVKSGYGTCRLVAVKGKEPFFVVRVKKALPEEMKVEILCHEWAHALAWGSDHPSFESHGPEWGLAYARCYRMVLEDG